MTYSFQDPPLCSLTKIYICGKAQLKSSTLLYPRHPSYIVCLLFLRTTHRESFFHPHIHCKKRLAIFMSPAGINKLFPARESLVGDILAWDGKIGNLFYSVFRVPEKIGPSPGLNGNWFRGFHFAEKEVLYSSIDQ
jgi:hypothetical protein